MHGKWKKIKIPCDSCNEWNDQAIFWRFVQHKIQIDFLFGLTKCRSLNSWNFFPFFLIHWISCRTNGIVYYSFSSFVDLLLTPFGNGRNDFNANVNTERDEEKIEKKIPQRKSISGKNSDNTKVFFLLLFLLLPMAYLNSCLPVIIKKCFKSFNTKWRESPQTDDSTYTLFLYIFYGISKDICCFEHGRNDFKRKVNEIKCK